MTVKELKIIREALRQHIVHLKVDIRDIKDNTNLTDHLFDNEEEITYGEDLQILENQLKEIMAVRNKIDELLMSKLES